MAEQQQVHLDWKTIRERAGAYPQEAFRFVRDGLAHTVKMIYGENGEGSADRHVDGRQLCLGLRDYAVKQYGLLAPTVLSRWGIRRTDDFGRIVFAMIDAGLMRKADEDSLEHFHAVYDFEEAFSAVEVC